MKPLQEIEELCKKLKPLINDKADKLWHMYLAEDDKGRKDIALDIEIIAEKYLKKEALENKQILLEPPIIENSKGNFLVGDIIYNHQKYHSLYLKPEDFIKQIGIFAVTGEGKTNLAYLLALQLLKQKIPFIVIDWKRSWRNLLSLKGKYPGLNQVQVFTIGRDTLPFHWNPFRAPPDSNKQLWISTIAETLEKSHLSGPGVAYHFNKIYSKLLKRIGNDFYPNFFDGLRDIKEVRVTGREFYWKQTALRIFQSFTLGKISKVFNSRTPVKIEELLNKPVILELDLELPKPLRIFFSEIILRWIHLYRLSQGETEKLRHVLFLEEAHNLFQKSSYAYQQDSGSIENVYREIRAFGQGIVSITQHSSLLPIYLLGNCHTQIYLGLQHTDDIQAARKSLFLKYDEECYPNLLNVGECIVKIKNRIEPCLVKTPLVPVKKGLVNDEWLRIHGLSFMFWKYAWSGEQDKRNYEGLKNRIRVTLDNKKSCVNSEYTSPVNQNHMSYSTAPLPQNNSNPRFKNSNYNPRKPQNNSVNIRGEKRKSPLNNKSIKLLEDIFLFPFAGIAKRYKRLGFSGYNGNNLKNILLHQRCVLQRNITTTKHRLTLFDLTQKGRMILRDSGHDVKDISEGIVHRFWKERTAESYRRQGYEVLVEKNINGRPDIIAKKDNKKIAIEIETGKSNFIFNIRRDLKANFDEVVCVATSRKAELRIREKVKDKGVVDERVRVILKSSFLQRRK